jgi:cell wall-associated NlpC family hydrolase
MTGTDVATLQEDLTIAGYPTLTTGIYSMGTKFHVEAFQARYRLSVDGVAGSTTVKRILRVVKAAVERQAAETAANGAASAIASTQSPTAAGTATTTTPTPTVLAYSNSGGAGVVPPPSDAPVQKATIDGAGLAVPPASAPMVIREVIDAANQIAFTPYVYGGGHASFTSVGYDCSGSTSFALHGGGLLTSPLDSSQFESYGLPGPGRWITMWANGGHVYMQIAGLFYDTAAQTGGNGNDRWSTTRISPRGGFVEIHPAGW